MESFIWLALVVSEIIRGGGGGGGGVPKVPTLDT